MLMCVRPTRHIAGHSGDGESFQAIDCTGSDNQNQRNKTLHRIPDTRSTNKKPALSNKKFTPRSDISVIWSRPYCYSHRARNGHIFSWCLVVSSSAIDDLKMLSPKTYSLKWDIDPLKGRGVI